jgi:hypothetical protein
MAALLPPAAATLARWHAMVRAADLAALPGLIAADAVFRSPVAHQPYASREAVVLVLRAAYAVFEDFRYHRELFTEGGLDAVLEFSAAVGGRRVEGVDMIAFGDDGLIREFKVMVRPASGLQALAEAMGQRIGALLPAFKAPG